MFLKKVSFLSFMNSALPSLLDFSGCWQPSSIFADLEKAASGASGACGHFVGNHAILRTFWAKYSVLFSEDGGIRIDNG